MNNLIFLALFAFFVLVALAFLVIFWMRVRPLISFVPSSKILFFSLVGGLLVFSCFIGFKIFYSSETVQPKTPQIQSNF